jgi:hypothetical protein
MYATNYTSLVHHSVDKRNCTELLEWGQAFSAMVQLLLLKDALTVNDFSLPWNITFALHMEHKFYLVH